MNITKLDNNINFNARCVQVRDADWVCQTISQNFPHFSPTKQQTRIIKFLEQNKNNFIFDKQPKTLSDVYEILLNNKNCTNNNKIKTFLDSIKTTLTLFADKRMLAQTFMQGDKLYESLCMVENFKLGNCSENAVLAEFILKLNNIHNACCAAMYKKKYNNFEDLDHAICVFNRDGKPFDGNITKNTIIVDPWVGKADFAKNMERFYRDNFSNYFNINKDETFAYERAETVNLPDFALAKLKDNYSNLIFKNKNRKFMQK